MEFYEINQHIIVNHKAVHLSAMTCLKSLTLCR